MPIIISPSLLRHAAVRGPLDLLPGAASLLAGFALAERIEEGPERLAWQQAALTGLAAHAKRHSPFWAARFGTGQRPLSALPILTRAEARQQVETEGALPLPKEQGEPIRGSTSGSTGTPLAFHVSRPSAWHNAVLYTSQHFRVPPGADPAKELVRLQRFLAQPLTVARPGRNSAEQAAWPGILGQMFRTGPCRSRPTVPGYIMEDLAEWLGSQHSIGHLHVMPHVFFGLLDLVAEGKARLPGLASAWLYGETVTPAHRARLNEVLGPDIPITSSYSCEEVGPIGFECRAQPGNYHVASTNVVVEVVDQGGAAVPAGTVGRVLVTGLHSHATPFIRYEIGDLAALQPGCACGHRGPTLGPLLGRERSLIRLPDGTRRWLRMNTRSLFKVTTAIRAYRVVQDAAFSVVLELEMNGTLQPGEEAALLALLQETTHPEFRVAVRVLDAIDWGSGPKRSEFVSRI